MSKIINQTPKELFLKAFGRFIQRKRIAKGLSRKELAVRSNSYAKKIARIEESRFDLKISGLIELAQGLDIRMRELFDFEIPPEFFEDYWKAGGS